MTATRPWRASAPPLWGCPPPKPKVQKYPVFKIDYGRPKGFHIVSSALLGVRTHWYEKRTVPCTGEQGHCWLDHAEVGSGRWSGWLAVRPIGERKVYLVSLTPVAVATEPRLLDADLDLRGLTVALWRVENHDRGEMRANIDSNAARVTDLPPEPHLHSLIERLWEAPDRGRRTDAPQLRELARAQALSAGVAV